MCQVSLWIFMATPRLRKYVFYFPLFFNSYRKVIKGMSKGLKQVIINILT